MKELKNKAYEVTTLTIEEARKLPGFLGKIVPIQLQVNGYYACKDDLGVRYYELAK